MQVGIVEFIKSYNDTLAHHVACVGTLKEIWSTLLQFRRKTRRNSGMSKSSFENLKAVRAGLLARDLHLNVRSLV